jgi:hypothetical protein
VILRLEKYLIVHKTKQNVILYLANTLMMKNIRQHPGGGGLTLYVITRGGYRGSFFYNGTAGIENKYFNLIYEITWGLPGVNFSLEIHAKLMLCG